MKLNEEGRADVPREEENVIATVLADGVDGDCGDGDGDGDEGGGGPTSAFTPGGSLTVNAEGRRRCL